MHLYKTEASDLYMWIWVDSSVCLHLHKETNKSSYP